MLILWMVKLRLVQAGGKLTKVEEDLLMADPTKSLEGKQYGKITVIRFLSKNKMNQHIWECKCECGNIIQASYHGLKSQIVLSCGCLNRGQ